MLHITHASQYPAVTVYFSPARGVALGDAVSAVEQAQAALRAQGMPLSIETSLQGAASAFSASLMNTLWLILAAVVTMYIVLGMLYESYIHPVTILSTLPSAAVGALLALLLSLPVRLSLRLWRWQRYARQQTQLAAYRRQLAERHAHSGATPC